MSDGKSDGKAEPKDKALGSGSDHGQGRCVFCNGSGKVTVGTGQQNCPRCNGGGSGPRVVTK